jgi:hypothetical protein
VVAGGIVLPKAFRRVIGPFQCRQPSLSISVLKPSGSRGDAPSSTVLQDRQSIPAPPQAADFALTTASIEMKWKSGWSAAATFEGEFSTNYPNADSSDAPPGSRKTTRERLSCRAVEAGWRGAGRRG